MSWLLIALLFLAHSQQYNVFKRGATPNALFADQRRFFVLSDDCGDGKGFWKG